jgi:hypothetical protein
MDRRGIIDGERGTKVGTINRSMSRGLGRIQVLTPSAVEFARLLVWDVGQAEREKRLGLAIDAGAVTKIRPFVFFKLGG